MLGGQILGGLHHAVSHPLEDGVSRCGCNCPLAELDKVHDISPAGAIASVEFEAYDSPDLALELFRDPVVDRLDGHCIGIGVDAPFNSQDEVSEEIRSHSHVRHLVVRIHDFRLVGEMASDEFVAPFLSHQRATGPKCQTVSKLSTTKRSYLLGVVRV